MKASLWFAATVFLAGVGACDPVVFAGAMAPLVAPIDSACFRRAIMAHEHVVAPILGWTPPHGQDPGRYVVTVGATAYMQEYAATGARLRASEILAAGGRAIFFPSARSDSADHALEERLFAFRDACGGAAP